MSIDHAGVIFGLEIGDGSSSSKPVKRFIVFRDDDIGAFWSDDSAIYITEVFRSRNVSHVMAVVPTRLEGGMLSDDRALSDYLWSIRDDPTVEFALHGYNHDEYEFGDISYDDAMSRISSGSDILADVTGVVPVTFAPPYNEYNDDVVRAVEDTPTMRVFSAGDEDIRAGRAFKRVNGILHLPTPIFFYNWGEERYFTADEIIDSCVHHLDEYGFCGFVMHHHMFADDSGIDQKKVQVLIDVIDWAKNQERKGDARIVRMKDISVGDLQ
ncbi:MAG: DUF2334 domain-containing protein [archaeon]